MYRQQVIALHPSLAAHITPVVDPAGISWTVGMVTCNQLRDSPGLEAKILYTIKRNIYFTMFDLQNRIARAITNSRSTPDKILTWTDTFELVKMPFTLTQNRIDKMCWILYAAPFAMGVDIFKRAKVENEVRAMIISPRDFKVYSWGHMEVQTHPVECTICKLDDHPTFTCPYTKLNTWFGPRHQVSEVVRAYYEERRKENQEIAKPPRRR